MCQITDVTAENERRHRTPHEFARLGALRMREKTCSDQGYSIGNADNVNDANVKQ